MPQRFKRDYQDDPKDYLDKVIEHWIYKIPVLIDIAVAESEKDLKLTVAKRVTQVKFRFSKKATKFETISHLILRLLSKCQIKWEIVSNFCGLFRMSEL